MINNKGLLVLIILGKHFHEHTYLINIWKFLPSSTKWIFKSRGSPSPIPDFSVGVGDLDTLVMIRTVYFDCSCKMICMSALKMVGIKIWLVHPKALGIRMQKLVLYLSLVQILPEKIKKMFSQKSLDLLMCCEL